MSHDAKPSTIAIAGGIAVGKSTLATELGEHLGFTVCEEPAAKNSYLEDFYQDKAKYAFSCQVDFLALRFGQHASVMNEFREGKHDGVVLDRSVFEDPIFAGALHASKHMDARDYKTYLRLFDTMVSHLPTGVPEVVLYLDAKPEILLSRIRERGRACESGITTVYLSGLQAQYEQFLEDMAEKTEVFVADWTAFHDAKDTWKALCRQCTGEKGMRTLSV